MTEHDVMARRLPVSLFLLGASLAGANLVAFGPALAQAPLNAPASPATSPAVTPPAPAAPASDTAATTQSPAPPSTPAAAPTQPAASPAPAAPAGPSAETLKKARMAGYRPETKNGTTMYCQETANLGTRFPTKKCLNEQQLNGVVDIQHQQQDSMRKPINCTGGPGCGAG
jgi:hypothetical protein